MSENPQDWIAINDEVPGYDIVVQTKIDDGRGVRNEQKLKRRGVLWFLCDGSEMYVYYTPTHWRPIE